MATTEVEKEFWRQAWLLLVSEKLNSNASDDVASWRGLLTVAIRREVELLSSTSAASC